MSGPQWLAPPVATLTAISLFLNRLTGGAAGQTLCARMARRYGHDCLFCRVIGAVTLDREHCWGSLLNDVRRKP